MMPSFALSLCFIFFNLFLGSSSLAQVYQDDARREDIQVTQRVYRESALRRFEIIFTISLPFTSLHSYLAVRGVEMVKQRKVSPEMKRADWNAVGGLTILFSSFVAFWDWMHTHDQAFEKSLSKRVQGADAPRKGVSEMELKQHRPPVQPGAEPGILGRSPKTEDQASSLRLQFLSVEFSSF